MNKIVRFQILLTIVSLSCNVMTGLFTDPGLVEATGPIIAMTVAASLDDQGRPVDASFTYPADQPQMVVLVRMGEVTPGPLIFSWVRVTEAGDEPLFEQTVEVEAGDAAFSTGLNAGILAAGTYKVVANFAGESETIAWDIAESQPVDSAAPVGTSASSAGGAPTPGPSGTAPLPKIILEPGDPGAGAVIGVDIIDVNRANRVKFSVDSAWKDGQGNLIVSPTLFFVQVRIGISGSTPDASRDFNHIGGIARIHKNYFQDPCKLPDGSDLPGTSITVTAFRGRSQSQEGLQTATAVLSADTSAPMVQLISEPSNGAEVEAGNKIVVSAIAEEIRAGGSWQTGVSKIEIFVMEPSGEELLAKKYDEYQGKSCEAKSWKQTTEKVTYEVPEGVKGDIRICAFGYDFAGNPPAKKCYTYHTGKQLKGTLNLINRFDTNAKFNSTTEWQEDADLSLNLEPGGTLTGTAKIKFTLHGEGNMDCGTWSRSYDPIQVTLPVNGEWTEDAIVFRFTSDAPIITAENDTTCDINYTGQVDITGLVQAAFIDYHATWDGQAYTADETINNSGAGWTSEDHYTIHLEPPAPGVGFSPGLWASASVSLIMNSSDWYE